MSTLADSLVDAASRSLNLRMRPDLAVRRHFYQGRPFWVVKEPVALKYFRFEEEEFAILEMLDGQASMDTIKKQFEREYAPQKIAYQDLQHFIGNLYRSGLLVANAPGQGEHLYRRNEQQLWQKFTGAAANILAVRFRGIDPEKLLNWLDARVGWFFSRWMVMFNLLFGLSALLLVFVQFQTFKGRLPAFHEFFGAHNWLWLGGTLAVVKILHEFGHGLSCKRFGGECHEMGFMMLVLTPCLYCNVSDSWMLPNKYQRAAIGAAGMYVELFLATCATYLWWFSEPGLLNFLCLRVMFVCSVSTVMFNGNPLMRYDGYYILADLLEIPNLRQKSSDILRRLMMQYCFGLEQPDDPFLPKRNQFLFAFYTVAAVLYRWVVVFSIFLFLNSVLEPYGLKRIGQVFAVAGIVGLVVQPLYKLYRFVRIPGRVDQVKKKNVFISLGVLTAMAAAIFLIPLPHPVRCPFEVAARDAATVFIRAPGTLEVVHVKPGEKVEAATPLAELSNAELDLAIIELERQVEAARVNLDNIRHQQFVNPAVGPYLATAEKDYNTKQEILAEKKGEMDRLTVTAPTAGTVLPPPVKAAEKLGEGRLPTWSGSPFDGKNQGARLNPSDIFCQIGDPRKLEAIMLIDQADALFLKVGQTVRIKLDAYPDRTFESKIVEISKHEAKSVAPSLTSKGGGDVATKADPSGMQKPLSTAYQAKAALDDPEGMFKLGLRGHAKVYAQWEPIAPRIGRWLANTFHFRI